MRTEQRPIGYEEIFIATDGTEFKSFSECEDYELSMENKIRDKLKDRLIEFTPADINLFSSYTSEFYMECYKFFAFKPRSEQDIDDFVELVGFKADDDGLSIDTINFDWFEIGRTYIIMGEFDNEHICYAFEKESFIRLMDSAITSMFNDANEILKEHQSRTERS